jgi:hypothetical protein
MKEKSFITLTPGVVITKTLFSLSVANRLNKLERLSLACFLGRA